MVYLLLHPNCIRQPVSLLFPPLFSFWNKEKRKQQGNYLSSCFIPLASDTKRTHATRVTTLWLTDLFSQYDKYSVVVLSYAGGVASRLATAIYVAMVTPILYDSSYSPNGSNLQYESDRPYG